MGKHKEGDKRERDRNWRDAEVQALCQFVAMNKKSLFGSGGHVSVRVQEQRERMWERGSEYLLTHGFSRSAGKIQRKWSNLKMMALRYKTAREATGGGEMKVDPIQEMILEAIAKEAVEGVLGPEEEAGFSSSQSTVDNDHSACEMLQRMGPSPLAAEGSCSIPSTSVKADQSPLAKGSSSTTSVCETPTPHPPMTASQKLVLPDKERNELLAKQNDLLQKIAVSLKQIADQLCAPPIDLR